MWARRGQGSGANQPSKRTSRTEGRRGRGAHAGAPGVGSSGHRVPAAHNAIPTAPASKTRRALPPGCRRQIVRDGDEQTEQRGWSWRRLACPPPPWRRRRIVRFTAGSRLRGSCCSFLSPAPCRFKPAGTRCQSTAVWHQVGLGCGRRCGACFLGASSALSSGGPGASRQWRLHGVSCSCRADCCALLSAPLGTHASTVTGHCHAGNEVTSVLMGGYVSQLNSIAPIGPQATGGLDGTRRV